MAEKYREVNSCEVCGCTNLISVLDLGRHPLCDDLVPIGDNRVCNEYPIEVLFCPTCITAHQRFQVPKHDLFPALYHYRSRFTVDVLQGMSELVEACEQRLGSLAGKKILDIGCNDGSLLDFFQKKGAITAGIEPTDAYLDAENKGHFILNGFLSKEVVDTLLNTYGRPDIITFTNVFAHIENLPGVISSLMRLRAPQTIFVIENHYLGSVLDKGQFDTFYHEHPRSYSYTSFAHIARSLETHLLDVEFPARYGGNIRVFLGNTFSGNAAAGADKDGNLRAQESQFLKSFSTLRENVGRWASVKKRELTANIQQYGKLPAKAFPARAAILVKLLGLDENSISAVYEKAGSLKIGHYVPGTRIPILADEHLFRLENKKRPLLNLAWHIPKEIRTYMSAHYPGPIIDIVRTEDFMHIPTVI